MRELTYLYLGVAVIAEVIATSALKASDEFTRLGPSLLVIVGYAFSFYLMTLVLRTLPIGITYAIWSGAGIVLVSLVGVFYYKQHLDLPAIIGMTMIILGVVVIHVFSKSLSH